LSIWSLAYWDTSSLKFHVIFFCPRWSGADTYLLFRTYHILHCGIKWPEIWVCGSEIILRELSILGVLLLCILVDTFDRDSYFYCMLLFCMYVNSSFILYISILHTHHRQELQSAFDGGKLPGLVHLSRTLPGRANEEDSPHRELRNRSVVAVK
jgi:hypothetical protein